jgi:hypothetical protein
LFTVTVRVRVRSKSRHHTVYQQTDKIRDSLDGLRQTDTGIQIDSQTNKMRLTDRQTDRQKQTNKQTKIIKKKKNGSAN